MDDAFYVLVLMAVPVCAFVFAGVTYSMLRFCRRRGVTEDGPPVHSNNTVVAAWFIITTALTILVIIYPGTIGLFELRDHGHSQGTASGNQHMVIEVEGGQWLWKITYPEQGVISYAELVVPLGQEARFEVTATDVIHSFWVPAFRMKIDALPGRTTTIYATPDKLGSFESEDGFRLQSAELCGIGHFAMMMPVRVVDPAEFDSWISQQVPSASSGQGPIKATKTTPLAKTIVQ